MFGIIILGIVLIVFIFLGVAYTERSVEKLDKKSLYKYKTWKKW